MSPVVVLVSPLAIGGPRASFALERLGLTALHLPTALDGRTPGQRQPVADAAFALPSGGTSDVVVGSFGPVLLKVTDITPARPDEEIVQMQVRFRTVGDITCTAPVESDADTIAKIIAETAETSITERGATRLDDQTSDASMEQRKKEGYF